jgi:hypothetical protein
VLDGDSIGERIRLCSRKSRIISNGRESPRTTHASQKSEAAVGIRIPWMEFTEWVSDPYLVTYAETSAPTPIGRDLSVSPNITTGLPLFCLGVTLSPLFYRVFVPFFSLLCTTCITPYHVGHKLTSIHEC